MVAANTSSHARAVTGTVTRAAVVFFSLFKHQCKFHSQSWWFCSVHGAFTRLEFPSNVGTFGPFTHHCPFPPSSVRFSKCAGRRSSGQKARAVSEAWIRKSWLCGGEATVLDRPSKTATKSPTGRSQKPAITIASGKIAGTIGKQWRHRPRESPMVTMRRLCQPLPRMREGVLCKRNNVLVSSSWPGWFWHVRPWPAVFADLAIAKDRRLRRRHPMQLLADCPPR